MFLFKLNDYSLIAIKAMESSPPTNLCTYLELSSDVPVFWNRVFENQESIRKIGWTPITQDQDNFQNAKPDFSNPGLSYI